MARLSAEAAAPLPIRERDAKPTAGYIRNLFSHNETFWSPQRSLDSELTDLYFNEHSFTIPDTNHPDRSRRIEPEVVKSSEAARIINTVVPFYSAPAIAAVRWLGSGRHSPEEEDETEMALNEAMDQLNPAVDRPRDRDIFNMALYGRLARLGPIPAPSYWSDFPFKAESESEDDWHKRFLAWHRRVAIPLLWNDLPPDSTFPPGLSSADDEVLSTIKTNWVQLADIFNADELGGVIPSERDKWWEEVTLAIYSNRKWLSYCVLDKGSPEARKDAVLRNVEHRLGRSAIRILPGMTTGRKEPGKYWRSVLFHVRDLIVSLDKRLSEAATAGHFDAFPMMAATLQMTGDDESGARAQIENLIGGDVVVLRAGSDVEKEEKFGPVFQPQFGEKTQALAQVLAGMTARVSGATSSLEGGAVSAGQTAWSHFISLDTAKHFWKPLTEAVISSDLDAYEMIIYSVIAFGEKIRLNPRAESASSVVLDPEKLKDWIPFLRGEYRLQIPNSQRAEIDLGMGIIERKIAAGVPISTLGIMERFMGYDQPWEEVRKAEVEAILFSPELRAARVKKALEEMDVAIAGEEGMSIEEFSRTAQAEGIPPEIVQAVIANAQGGQQQSNGTTPASAVGGGGGGRRLRGETIGQLRAESPLSTGPGGGSPSGGGIPT